LFEGLQDTNFMVVAVAEESRGADHARPWIEAAKPGYLNLIDPEHRVAALYGMVNVPQCVWIDEAGTVVRPPEAAGATDHFRRMDLSTRTLAPDLQAARMAARTAYLDALRAWVRTGVHALPPEQVRRALPRITPDIALADAHFRLALWLRAHDDTAAAARHFAEASRLHPQSWNIWRQAADLEAVGRASGPEFWARVQALGDRPYYVTPDLAAFSPPGKG
jgi:hypothetical protein